MGLLTELYLAGLLGISLPVLLHLIRRTPRGQRQFSSLMFLSPSPPRLTRRSRLDHWLLLLLRAAALALLAFAFSRPFLREVSRLTFGGAVGRRVVLLIDTSASMRREGVWQQAAARAEQILDDADAMDEVAIYAFDRSIRPLVRFEELAEYPRPDQRAALLRDRLAALQPTWAATDLGTALGAIVDVLQAADEARVEEIGGVRQIVLISDLQEGSQLESLQSLQWPDDIVLDVQVVRAVSTTNAGIQFVSNPDDAPEAADGTTRIRITNDADSLRETFQVAWSGVTPGIDNNDAQPIYVPPGESRVIRMPPRPRGAENSVVLSGDDHNFDNTVFLPPLDQEQVLVWYLGNDADDDVQGLRYYLQRALPQAARREMQFVAYPAEQPLILDATPTVIVVGDAIGPENLPALKAYLDAGGTVLWVLRDTTTQTTLDHLLDVNQLPLREAEVDAYAMLVDIDFADSLFAPFAAPQYRDFTKIHFWKHRHAELPPDAKLQVLARFDSGAAALFGKRFGRLGRLLVLTSGWNPADSQLALSSKFVPLLARLLDGFGEVSGESLYHVNDEVRLPDRLVTAANIRVQRPDGSETLLATGSSQFTATDQPGIYHLRMAEQERGFAVNISANESKTAIMDPQQLAHWGVRLGRQLSVAESADRDRQRRDKELENEQKLWRWLLVMTLAVLIAESWLAGRLSRVQASLTPA